jgi:hypothetical protein
MSDVWAVTRAVRGAPDPPATLASGSQPDDESWPRVQRYCDAVFGSQLPSVARHILVTLAFGTDPRVWPNPRGVSPTFSDLQRWTGLARSTVAEYVIAVERAGWLDRNPVSGGVLKIGDWVLRVGSPTCVRRETIPPEVRARVFERDGGACRRCARTADLTIDHVVPFAAGGTDDEENLQTLCRPCNSRKGASLPALGA